MALQAPNHTKLSNEFVDEYLCKVSSSAAKVFIAITRKTIGWHKDSDYISISQIIKMTGLSNRVVIKATKELEDFDIIRVNRKEKRTNEFVINYESYDEKSQGYDEKSQVLDKSYDEKSHTKESIKETITKDILQQQHIINILFNTWIDSGLIHHTLNTVVANIKKKHISTVKQIGIDQITEAIKLYATVLKSDLHYFSYSYTLWDFISRGYGKFLKESDPLKNFLKKSNNFQQKTSKTLDDVQEAKACWIKKQEALNGN
jgi:phage replication O-like protein O